MKSLLPECFVQNDRERYKIWKEICYPLCSVNPGTLQTWNLIQNRTSYQNPTLDTEMLTHHDKKVAQFQHQPPHRATAVCECAKYYSLTCWMLTSQPFGVVLDCTQDRATFSQTSVNHRIARQEVCHGGWVEITAWEKEGSKKKVIEIHHQVSQFPRITHFLQVSILVTGDFYWPLKRGRG